MADLISIGKSAKEAAAVLRSASTDMKNKALHAIAKALREHSDKILAANKLDLENGRASGMSKALLDRLALTSERIESIAYAAEYVAKLDDPVGQVVRGSVRPNGLKIQSVRVPIGVVAIIYEARPNVTVDGAALCLKSGNAVILRGGKEAINSNISLADIMRNAIESVGLPRGCISLIEDISRETANRLMKLNDYVDVLIPRGGAGLINAVIQNSTVPVIQTGEGNCHIYVDKSADVKMASEIVFNAKTSRPSVCNAVETVLVHSDAAKSVLPAIAEKLKEKQVEIRGCERTREILSGIYQVVPASDEDYYTEFLDYILAVKVVDSINEAVSHIEKYGSGHSEAIITNDYKNADLFVCLVDSAAVYVNASTRFTDGGEFGLGAEIGISTQKLHARGPMGLKELTSVKHIVYGSGQVR